MAAKRSAQTAKAKKAVAAKPAAKTAVKPAPQAAAAAPKRPAGPSARLCPLVMDGEVDAAEFSPSDCLTCSEFDCRFCEAEQGSGALRSRLFAAGGDGDGDDEGFGGDFDFESGGGDAFEGEDDGDEEIN